MPYNKGKKESHAARIRRRCEEDRVRRAAGLPPLDGSDAPDKFGSANNLSITKFMNRLLALGVEKQHEVFNFFELVRVIIGADTNFLGGGYV